MSLALSEAPRLRIRLWVSLPGFVMKRVLFTVLGILAGSALAWGCLLSWAALNLDPRDSLFDRDPQALQIFLGAWLASAVLGALIGRKASGEKPR